jgi:invasion protein IalB
MTFLVSSAPARPVRRAVIHLAAAVSVVALAGAAFAQQPAPAPGAPKAAPAAPKPAAPKAPAPAAPKGPTQAAPAAPGAQPQPQQQAGGEQMPVVYSPWTKFCGKDQQPGAKEVCLTVKEARLETGQFLAGAALIEQQGEEKKIFRITLPLGMQLPQGTRVVVDSDQPVAGRYIVCLPNGCMADFEVSTDFVGKLKKGQNMVLQGINLPGQAASYPIPLTDFAKANEGPPTDPKVFEEQQKKLQEELQRRAEAARQRLQQQNGTPGAAPPR